MKPRTHSLLPLAAIAGLALASSAGAGTVTANFNTSGTPAFTGGVASSTDPGVGSASSFEYVFDISSSGSGLGAARTLKITAASTGGNINSGGNNGIAVTGGVNNAWWDETDGNLTFTVVIADAGGADITNKFTINFTGASMRWGSGTLSVAGEPAQSRASLIQGMTFTSVPIATATPFTATRTGTDVGQLQQLRFDITAVAATSNTRTWDGDNTTDGQWNRNVWENFDGTFVDNDSVVFGTTNVNNWTLTALGGARTLKSLTFQSGSPAYDIRLATGISSLTAANLAFSSPNTGLTVESGDTSSHTIGQASVGGNIVMLDNLTVTHNGSGTLAFERPIAGTGTIALTKAGTGTMKLNAANTYTGATQVNGGILTIGSLAAKGATSGITAGPSGIVGLGLGSAGSTTHYLAADVATLFNNALAGYSLDATSGVAVDTTAANAPSYLIDQGSGNILTGSRSFTKLGIGDYRMNAANDYTGATHIKQGTLSLGVGTNSGLLNPLSTITVSSGATFQIWKNVVATQGTHFGNITGAGNFYHAGGAGSITQLTQTNSYSGVTSLNLSGQLEFSVAANGGSPSSLGSSSNAASNLLLSNSATLRYTGAAGSTDRSFTINGTGNGHQAILDASGTGPISFTNTASPAYGVTDQLRTLVLAGTNTGDNTLAAGVADNGTGIVTITKNGPGKWILSGTSTNTAGVIMNEGTLLIEGSLSGGANLNVNGGTLGGTGTIGRQVAVYPGGSVSPGGSAGNTLTLGGNLTFGVFTGITTGKLVYELGAIGSSDKIDLTAGTLVLGTELIDLDDFTLTDVGLENGTYTLISTTKVINGTLGSNTSGTLGGKNILLQKSGDNKNLELVVSGLGSPYDAWATSKGLTGLAGSSTDPAKDADPDKDGRNNLAEFAFNGNPLSGSDNGKVYVLTEDSDFDGDTTKELLLTIAVRTGTPAFAGSPPSANLAADSITYSVEGSLNLASFGTTVNVVPTPVTTGLPAAGDGYEYRSFSLDGSNGLTGKGFLRAKVTSP